jgi:hypothetical protein
MMMTPTTMAILAITVMLWILWSDTMRRSRPTPILYAVRIALYLIMSAILVLNMFRYPHLYGSGDRGLVVLAVIVGLVGAGYFGRRLVTRS